MGSSSSKGKEVNYIKAIEDMDEGALSSKDKMFKKAILELADEIKKVKDKKSDNIFYKLPVQTCNYSLF